MQKIFPIMRKNILKETYQKAQLLQDLRQAQQGLFILEDSIKL